MFWDRDKFCSKNCICWFVYDEVKYIVRLFLLLIYINLTEFDEINMIGNLKIYHLEIKYDGNKLIYDRKLKEGFRSFYLWYESL